MIPWNESLWVRSFPHVIPSNRSFVVDGLPRFLNENFDYREMFVMAKRSFCLVEWDIAIDSGMYSTFYRIASSTPDRVSAAPYKIKGVDGARWVMRREDASPVQYETEVYSAYFGFGLTYFPIEVIRRFREEWLPHLNSASRIDDDIFSRWYFANYGYTKIMWEVRPVHLHW